MSDNRDAFVRLANARVGRLIEDLRLIGNLANRTNYTYTEEDVNKIFTAIKTAVTDCRKRFDAAAVQEARRHFALD